MSMNNILPVKDGSKITLYDILLYNQWQHKGAVEKDHLFIVYRDNYGRKRVHTIPDPPMEIYFVKPEYRDAFLTPREYLPMDMVYPAKVSARRVLNRIYDELKVSNDRVAQKLRNVYHNAINTQQYRAKKEILKWPYTLMSDMGVVEYYWCHLGYHYDMMHGRHIIDKCFADIENDIYGLTSAQQEDNQDPVNAVTLIFKFDENGPNSGRNYEVHTYLLRNHKRYPQQKEFEQNLNKFYNVCHSQFDQQTIIKNGKKKIVNLNAKYQIHMCDTESDLLAKVFQHINYEKPDICEFWNMPYDMPKMKARMEKLGMDPVEHMCDSDFFPREMQFIQFNMDTRPIDIADRNSHIRMTSTTQYVDQMQNYAGIRKGRKAYGSNKLDNIAKIELGMGKLQFKKGVDIRNVAIKDYWNFVLYNIRDVWCQALIDFVTNDTMAVVHDMNQQNCPLHHLTKQTKYQKYIYYTWYLRKGFVPGNNVNTNYARYNSEEEQERATEAIARRRIREKLDKMGMDETDIDEIMSDPDTLLEYINEDGEVVDDNAELNEVALDEIAHAHSVNQPIFEDSIDRKLSLQGGLVGDPDFNSANGVELIDGVPSKHVFDEVMDQDYASEYPWAKYTRSLSRSTQIGRLIIPKQVSKYQNMLPLGQIKRPIDNRAYIPGAEFTADYLSHDWLSFGAVWFNLPLTDEMSELLEKALEEELL